MALSALPESKINTEITQPAVSTAPRRARLAGPEEAGEPWRATFTENGRRRFRQAMTEAELAAELEKVTERLRAGTPYMEWSGPART